nr:Mariner Mos1 transposase [Hymenolepis microstoma]
MQKSADWLRLTGLSQTLMVKRLAISDRTNRREWFQRFKSGDFAVEERHSGRVEKVVEDAGLKASDSLVNGQAISKRLKQLGMIERERYWAPHELKPRRDVERRLLACKQLMERQTRKEFLHHIVRYIIITPSARRKSWRLTGGYTATPVNTSAEYPWLESHALPMVVGPAYYDGLLKPFTDVNHHR